MKVTLTIPDEQVSRVITAFTNSYGYQAQIINRDTDGKIEYIPNTLTKEQFVKQCIMDFIRDTTKRYEIEETQKTALQNITEISIV